MPVALHFISWLSIQQRGHVCWRRWIFLTGIRQVLALSETRWLSIAVVCIQGQ